MDCNPLHPTHRPVILSDNLHAAVAIETARYILRIYIQHRVKRVQGVIGRLKIARFECIRIARLPETSTKD